MNKTKLDILSFAGISLAIMLFSISFCACKKNSPLPENNLAADQNIDATYRLDSLFRSGSFQVDGSYKWKIDFKIINNITVADSVTISIVKGADCPFILDPSSTGIAIKPLEFKYLELTVTIPANLVLNPDYSKAYSLTLVLKRRSVIKDSKLFTLYYPLPDHPRLFINKGDIADLKARFDHSDFSAVRSAYNTQKSYSTTGIVTSDKPNDAIRQKMEALAFEYLLDPATKSTSGTQAIQLAISYLNSFGSISNTVVSDYDDLGYTDEMIIGAAMVYDWCYPLMSPADRQKLRNAMLLVCKRTEYGLPTTPQKQYLSGHYGELQPTVYLAMGIATHEDDPSIFNYALNEQVNGFAPSRNPMYASGTHHQGAQYIHVRHSNELIQHFLLTKIGMSPYSKEINTITFRDIYGMIPQKTDMDGMAEGDGHNGLLMKYPQLYYLSAILSRDPYLQQISRSKLSLGISQSTRLFIYHDPKIPSTPVENSLCLSKYFPSPAGLLIARTKWDLEATDYNSGAMVVLMNMKEYNAQNHTHLDGGHFSIYYKGHLALDAGIYQGADANNGWGKDNYNNYYSRTIAHNCMTVFDPAEPLPVVGWNNKAEARDGGQFFFSATAWDNYLDMYNAGKSTQILACDIAPGVSPSYSYLKGDLTKAYNVPTYIGAYPSKVDTVRRSFVFLNHDDVNIPGTLIVLDKVVSTNPTFKKTWLLHTQNQPIVTANKIVATSTTSGRNGKLTTTVLMPEITNQSIKLVGGPGKEFWVNNKNYGTSTQEDAGAWRVELSPISPSKSDNFLNVLQVADNNNTQMPDIVKQYSENGKYVIVRVKDRVIVQMLTLGLNDQPINFTIGDASSALKILITDLKAGDWNISTPNGTFQKNVAVGSGTIYFESIGGKFTIIKN
jgi:Heparinase II C-terminal domain/Heparinase II/III-like protein